MLEGGIAALQQSTSTLWKVGTVRRCRLVDPPVEARRNEGNHDRDQVVAAFIAHDVGVVSVVDERLRSHPDTETPDSARISAMPLIPIPPMPTK